MSAGSEPEQIQEEIERTRAELGDTVEALAQKADVKRQAKRKIQETKASAATQVSEKARANPLPMVAAGAFAVGFVIGRASKR
jgi:ElaB/YqjD/DUF883 family membrane-anchored ribosome-binding protein